MKPNTLFVMLFALLTYFAPTLALEAVFPPPDGDYPGRNTAEGHKALFSLTTGTDNTALGWLSLQALSTGNLNTGVGAWTLALNSADYNTACGAAALLFNSTGTDNTATGTGALLFNTTGEENTATGAFALYSHTSGERNTANGFRALVEDTEGNRNTAIGAFALQNNSTGSRNIGLGIAAGAQVTTANDVICIGTDGENVSNSCYIGQIFGATVSTAVPVIVNQGGHLGTVSSSRRFKKEITPMASASEAVLALKPVTFHYKSDCKGTAQFGLIAEEVAEVNPDLVVRDKNGEIYTVRYEAVNAMLLNEFLKEHRKVQEQEATIAQLKSTLAKKETIDAHQQEQIEALTAGLQKVKAQLEASKPAPQVVKNTD